MTVLWAASICTKSPICDESMRSGSEFPNPEETSSTMILCGPKPLLKRLKRLAGSSPSNQRIMMTVKRKTKIWKMKMC